MSVSKNPDFWRSQKVGGENKPASQGDTPSSSELKRDIDTFAVIDSVPPIKTTKANSGVPTAPKSGSPTRASAPSPSQRRGVPSNTPNSQNTNRTSKKLNEGAAPSSGVEAPLRGGVRPGSLPASASAKANRTAGNGSSTGASAKGNGAAGVTPQAGSKTPPATKTGQGSGAPKSPAGGDSSSVLRDRLTGGAGRPANTANKKPSGETPKLNSADTAKGAAKNAAKEGIKGAAKGFATKGLPGAALGAAAGAASGAADKVNEVSDARKQAGGSRGGRGNGALDGMGAGALSKGHDSMQRRFGNQGGAAIGAKSGLPLDAQQAANISRAAKTVASETIKVTAKKAAAGIGMFVVIAFGGLASIAGSTTAPIVASVTSAYSAESAACDTNEDGSSDSSSTPGEHGSEEGLKEAAIKTLRYSNQQWGGRLENIYGLGDRNDHATGNALDLMIPDYEQPDQNALGWEIAKYFVDNAKEYGISYVIFDGKIWANGGNPDAGWNYVGDGNRYGAKDWAPYKLIPGMPNDANQRHENHVHISTFDRPGDTTMGTTTASSGVETLEIDRASVVSSLPTRRTSSDLESNPAAYGLAADSVTRKEQIANSKTIIGMAKTVGFNEEGAIIAIMTAFAESTLKNIDYGDEAGPDSRGLFQQRTNGGWGTEAEIANPAYAAQAFFLGVNGAANPGLESVAGWRDMDPWVAAQQVQRSAFSDGSNYQVHYEDAVALVGALYDSSPVVPAVTTGKVNQPDGSVNTDTSDNGCSTEAGGDRNTGAVAAGDTYPARSESYSRTPDGYAVQCSDSVAGGCRGECVDWSAWKLVEATGTYGTHKVLLGNGGDWGANAAAKGITVDMKPRAGDAVFFLPGVGGAGAVGHVATVQAVNGDGTVTIEEYNFGGPTPEEGGGRYNTRKINTNEASGYIHFLDPKKSKEENKSYLIDKGVLVPGAGNWPRK